MAKKLLVIDQNLAVHRLLEFTLSKDGFQIVAVEDGLAGLDAAYQNQPDLIMVSSQVEGVPLPRFIQKVRERESLRATPIILMAQPNENVNTEQARKAGVTDIIKKPLDAMELNAIITRCLPTAGGRARTEASASQPSASTEEDQEMGKMEEMLGWVPQEPAAAAPAAKPAAAPASKAPPPPKPVMAVADDEDDLPFELQTQHQQASAAPKTAPAPAAAATPAAPAAPEPPAAKEPVTVTDAAVSLEDLLITGADAMSFQPPPQAPPPPPPPPQEPEPTALDELFAAQEPIPVGKTADKPKAAPAPSRTAAPSPAPAASMATPVAGGSTPQMPISRQEAETLIRSMVEELTRGVARETVERLVKEIVPELAEREVKAEIERLKADDAG